MLCQNIVYRNKQEQSLVWIIKWWEWRRPIFNLVALILLLSSSAVDLPSSIFFGERYIDESPFALFTLVYSLGINLVSVIFAILYFIFLNYGYTVLWLFDLILERNSSLWMAKIQKGLFIFSLFILFAVYVIIEFMMGKLW